MCGSRPTVPLNFQTFQPSNISTLLFHYSLLTTPSHSVPENFYPPASDLRHNPAAQLQRRQSSSQTGRNQ